MDEKSAVESLINLKSKIVEFQGHLTFHHERRTKELNPQIKNQLAQLPTDQDEFFRENLTTLNACIKKIEMIENTYTQMIKEAREVLGRDPSQFYADN